MTMLALANAVVGLSWPAGWKVYPLNQAPQKLSTATLPILVFTEADGGAGDFKVETFGGKTWHAKYPALTHWFIYKPDTAGLQGKTPIVSQMIGFVDSYLAVARTVLGAWAALGDGIETPMITVGKLTTIPEGEGDNLVNYYARAFVWQLAEYL